MEWSSVLDTVLTNGITLQTLLLCTGASLVLGIACAAVFMIRNTYTKSFVVTLALLPAIVQTVIMLVNGNLGTGVAVMGAFSLVRFRSVPGSARGKFAAFSLPWRWDLQPAWAISASRRCFSYW